MKSTVPDRLFKVGGQGASAQGFVSKNARNACVHDLSCKGQWMLAKLIPQLLHAGFYI